jgi:hypothetical protein
VSKDQSQHLICVNGASDVLLKIRASGTIEPYDLDVNFWISCREASRSFANRKLLYFFFDEERCSFLKSVGETIYNFQQLTLTSRLRDFGDEEVQWKQ